MPKMSKITHNLLCKKCRKSRYFCGRILARISGSRKVYEVFHVCSPVSFLLPHTAKITGPSTYISINLSTYLSTYLFPPSTGLSQKPAKLLIVDYLLENILWSNIGGEKHYWGKQNFKYFNTFYIGGFN